MKLFSVKNDSIASDFNWENLDCNIIYMLGSKNPITSLNVSGSAVANTCLNVVPDISPKPGIVILTWGATTKYPCLVNDIKFDLLSS